MAKKKKKYSQEDHRATHKKADEGDKAAQKEIMKFYKMGPTWEEYKKQRADEKEVDTHEKNKQGKENMTDKLHKAMNEGKK